MPRGAGASADVAGPGFINLRLGEQSWRDELLEIVSEGERYGLSSAGNNGIIGTSSGLASPERVSRPDFQRDHPAMSLARLTRIVCHAGVARSRRRTETC